MSMLFSVKTWNMGNFSKLSQSLAAGIGTESQLTLVSGN